jgi:hypothetical protein
MTAKLNTALKSITMVNLIFLTIGSFQGKLIFADVFPFLLNRTVLTTVTSNSNFPSCGCLFCDIYTPALYIHFLRNVWRSSPTSPPLPHRLAVISVQEPACQLPERRPNQQLVQRTTEHPSTSHSPFSFLAPWPLWVSELLVVVDFICMPSSISQQTTNSLY